MIGKQHTNGNLIYANAYTIMEKLEKANKNIEHLVDMVVGITMADNYGLCLRQTLLGLKRNCCDKISCDECNNLSMLKYKEELLKKYLVK